MRCHFVTNYFFLVVQFTMEGLKLRMDNLFEGVKVLGEH